MIKIQVSDIINRPVEQVFAFAMDRDKSNLWQTENVVSEKPITDNTQVKVVQGPGIKSAFTMETTEFVPNHKTVTRGTAGGKGGKLSAVGAWLFEPVTEGTQVTFDWEVELSGLLKLTTPLFVPLAQRTLQRDLANLKRMLET